jgi:hypothetical protein
VYIAKSYEAHCNICVRDSLHHWNLRHLIGPPTPSNETLLIFKPVEYSARVRSALTFGGGFSDHPDVYPINYSENDLWIGLLITNVYTFLSYKEWRLVMVCIWIYFLKFRFLLIESTLCDRGGWSNNFMMVGDDVPSSDEQMKFENFPSTSFKSHIYCQLIRCLFLCKYSRICYWISSTCNNTSWKMVGKNVFKTHIRPYCLLLLFRISFILRMMTRNSVRKTLLPTSLGLQ